MATGEWKSAVVKFLFGHNTKLSDGESSTKKDGRESSYVCQRLPHISRKVYKQ